MMGASAFDAGELDLTGLGEALHDPYWLIKHIPGTDYDSPKRFLDVSDAESDEAVRVESSTDRRTISPLRETPDEKKARRLQQLQNTSFFTAGNDPVTSPSGSRPGSGLSTPARALSPVEVAYVAPFQATHISAQTTEMQPRATSPLVDFSEMKMSAIQTPVRSERTTGLQRPQTSTVKKIAQISETLGSGTPSRAPHPADQERLFTARNLGILPSNSDGFSSATSMSITAAAQDDVDCNKAHATSVITAQPAATVPSQGAALAPSANTTQTANLPAASKLRPVTTGLKMPSNFTSKMRAPQSSQTLRPVQSQAQESAQRPAPTAGVEWDEDTF